MPLGLMPGMTYEENEAVLAPGDCLLLHSDGIVEAHSPDARDVRLPAPEGDRRAAPGGGQALIDRVLAEVEAFTGADAEQEDDITMVTLQRSAGVILDEFDIPSEVGNERGAIDRVELAVRGLGSTSAGSTTSRPRSPRRR